MLLVEEITKRRWIWKTSVYLPSLSQSCEAIWNLAYHLESFSIMTHAWKYSPTVWISKHLFTKRADVLPQHLMKSRSREIRVQAFPIALKFDRHLGSRATEVPTKFQSNTIIVTTHLAASRLNEFWVNRLIPYWIELGPEWQETRVSPETK